MQEKTEAARTAQMLQETPQSIPFLPTIAWKFPRKKCSFPARRCDGAAPLALQRWTDLPSLAFAPCTSGTLGPWPRVDPGLAPFSRRSERC
jgi:hypothetical protein